MRVLSFGAKSDLKINLNLLCRLGIFHYLCSGIDKYDALTRGLTLCEVPSTTTKTYINKINQRYE